MNGLLEKLDSKLLTTAGAVVLAFLLAVLYYKTTNEGIREQFGSVVKSIEAQTTRYSEDSKELNTTLKELTKTMQENTQAARDLQILIRQR